MDPGATARRMRRRLVAAVVALPVLSVAVYLGAHQLGPEFEPRWSEADLPALPPEEDNGWLLIADEPLGTPPGASGVVATLERDMPSVDAARLVRDRPAVEEYLSDVRAEVALLDIALDEPRFVDASPLTFAADHDGITVNLLAGVRAHLLDALLMAVDGDVHAAWRTIGRVGRAVFDFTRNARLVVPCAVGVIMVRRALETANTLVALEGAMESESEGSVRRWYADQPLPRCERQAFIGDAVQSHRAIEDMPSGWLFDRDRTHDLMAAWTQRLSRAADTPLDEPLPDMTLVRPMDQFGWWAYNATGHELLQVLQVDQEPMLSKLRQDLRDIRDLTAALEIAE